MLEGLIGLLIFILIVAIVAAVVLWILQQLPLPAPFGQIARVVVLLIALLLILVRALPLLGVAV